MLNSVFEKSLKTNWMLILYDSKVTWKYLFILVTSSLQPKSPNSASWCLDQEISCHQTSASIFHLAPQRAASISKGSIVLWFFVLMHHTCGVVVRTLQSGGSVLFHFGCSSALGFLCCSASMFLPPPPFQTVAYRSAVMEEDRRFVEVHYFSLSGIC